MSASPAMSKPAGQRTIVQIWCTRSSSRPMSRPNARSTNATANRKPTLSASRNALPYFSSGGPVALDPVDPVDRALDLPERGRPGHDRPDQAERQRQEAVVRADLPRLLHGVREELAGEARHGVLDRVDDHAAHLEVAERGGEPDERDQPLNEDERHHEGERAGVAEAVGVPKPRERVRDEAHPAGVEKRLAGVVARQLPRLGDARRGAHDATGTQTSIAPGSTSISNDLTFSRSPPSSS